MTEKTRKKMVYLIFVAAVIFGAVNFLGSRSGTNIGSVPQEQRQSVQPIEATTASFTASADTSEWGRDPFARPVESEPTAGLAESLRLSAISGSADKPLAVINGKIVGKGESVEGWQVTMISSKSVQLQRNGNSKTLALGGS